MPEFHCFSCSASLSSRLVEIGREESGAATAALLAGDLWDFFCAKETAGQRSSNIPVAQISRSDIFIATFSVTQYRRGIRVFAEGFDIPSGKNFHHPAMEVIHRVILDRAKAAVVFFACFVDFTAPPIANVAVLTTQLDVLGIRLTMTFK